MSDPLFAGDPAQRHDESPPPDEAPMPAGADLASNGDRTPVPSDEPDQDAATTPPTANARFARGLRDALTGDGSAQSAVDPAHGQEAPVPAPAPVGARARPRRPILRDEVYTERIEAGRELRDTWLRRLLERARELLRTRAERAELALDAEVEGLRAQTVSGTRVIALVSPRGGVGKTSLAYVLGSMLADTTRMSVIAVDGDLDYGPLADLADDAGQASLSLADALRDFDARPSLAQLNPYLSTTPSGLRILAAPADRAQMKQLGPDHYDRLLELLADAEIVLVDCPGGIERGIPEWAIARADHLVVVTEPKYVSANNVGRALESLPLERATLVLNKARPRGPGNQAAIEAWFAKLRAARQVTVPHDEQLASMLDTATYRLDALRRATRVAIKRLCVAVGQTIGDAQR